MIFLKIKMIHLTWNMIYNKTDNPLFPKQKLGPEFRTSAFFMDLKK